MLALPELAPPVPLTYAENRYVRPAVTVARGAVEVAPAFWNAVARDMPVDPVTRTPPPNHPVASFLSEGLGHRLVRAITYPLQLKDLVASVVPGHGNVRAIRGHRQTGSRVDVRDKRGRSRRASVLIDDKAFRLVASNRGERDIRSIRNTSSRGLAGQVGGRGNTATRGDVAKELVGGQVDGVVRVVNQNNLDVVRGPRDRPSQELLATLIV